MANVVELPRGGFWVDTPAGPIQLGAPSETIKDTLTREGGVPRTIILPSSLFDARRGRSLADLEFPIYFNLFAKQRPLTVIGPSALEERMRIAVQESLLGPAQLDLTRDVGDGVRVPDVARELAYFRKGPNFRTGRLEIDDALDYRATEGRPVELGEGVVVNPGADAWEICWGGEVRARLPLHARVPEPRRGAAPAAPFVPPRFGVTILGRSHGFDPDPQERTSGFVLWVSGRGIVVDPPVGSTEILSAAEIDLKLIDGILLTHCHADHDAGTLEKALEAGRVTLYTTSTIFESYKRKWSAISGIPAKDFEGLFDFRPVRVGVPLDISGAQFLFRFPLHSIPTIAFEVHLGGRSFNYSSDHLNDPRQIEKIFTDGHLEPERREELLHFNWNHDVIFHEAGVPPLHTPLEVLSQLPADVRARTYVLHTTPSRMAPNSGLQLGVPGASGTLDFKLEASPAARVIRNLAWIGRAPLFASLPLERAAELLAASRELTVPAGQRFIAAGEELTDRGADLYIVTGGKASVRRGGRELKVYGLGDYIGETAVFLGSSRTADVVALTDLELLAIDADAARRACAGTSIPDLVARHARVRDWDTWSLLEETELLAGLTATQKNTLETILHPVTLRVGAQVLRAGVRAKDVFLIHSGSVEQTGEAAGTLSRGQLVGDLAALLAGAPQRSGGKATTQVRGYRIGKSDLESFLDRNPGIKVRVQPWSVPSEASVASASLIQMLEDYL